MPAAPTGTQAFPAKTTRESFLHGKGPAGPDWPGQYSTFWTTPGQQHGVGPVPAQRKQQQAGGGHPFAAAQHVAAVQAGFQKITVYQIQGEAFQPGFGGRVPAGHGRAAPQPAGPARVQGGKTRNSSTTSRRQSSAGATLCASDSSSGARVRIGGQHCVHIFRTVPVHTGLGVAAQGCHKSQPVGERSAPGPEAAKRRRRAPVPAVRTRGVPAPPVSASGCRTREKGSG